MGVLGRGVGGKTIEDHFSEVKDKLQDRKSTWVIRTVGGNSTLDTHISEFRGQKERDLVTHQGPESE